MDARQRGNLTRRSVALAFALAACAVLGIVIQSSGRIVWHYTLSEVPTDVPIVVTAAFGTYDSSDYAGARVGAMAINIMNTSDSLVSIDWDNCALTTPDGTRERVIHTGVDYLAAGEPQAPSPIPPHGTIEEAIWPASRIERSGPLDLGWGERDIEVLDGSVIGLYISWSQEGTTHGAQWKWRFQSQQVEDAPRQEVEDTPRTPRKAINWLVLVTISLTALGLIIAALVLGDWGF